MIVQPAVVGPSDFLARHKSQKDSWVTGQKTLKTSVTGKK